MFRGLQSLSVLRLGPGKRVLVIVVVIIIILFITIFDVVIIIIIVIIVVNIPSLSWGVRADG
jgi:hypothetical protein